MKNSLLIVILLISQLKYSFSQNITKEYFPNGKIRSEGEVLNELKMGRWMYYYDNGYIESTGSYLNDSLNGKWEFYFDNGQLKGIVYYTMSSGKNKGRTGIPQEGRNGDFISYYPEGEILQKQQWKKGILDGEFISYFNNGKIEFSGFYKNGLKDSAWIYYYENGNISNEAFYIDDTLSGISKIYNDVGNLVKVYNVKNGISDGQYIEYYNNGNKKEQGTYINNRKNGLWTTWFSNGNKKSEGEYFDDIKLGFWQTWFKNGIKASEGKHRGNNIREGFWQQWHENGQLASSGKYNKGFIGHWIFWEEDGIRVERFFNKAGELLGESKAYYPNGKLYYIMIYGDREDSFSTEFLMSAWDKNGKQTLENGNGKLYIYYKNDEIKTEFNYLNGTLAGKTYEYFPFGMVFYITKYEKDFSNEIAKYPDFKRWDRFEEDKDLTEEYKKLLTDYFKQRDWKLEREIKFANLPGPQEIKPLNDTIKYEYIIWLSDGTFVESNLGDPDVYIKSYNKQDIFINSLDLLKSKEEVLIRLTPQQVLKSDFLPQIEDELYIYLSRDNRKLKNKDY